MIENGIRYHKYLYMKMLENNRNDTHAGYSCGNKQHKCYRT